MTTPATVDDRTPARIFHRLKVNVPPGDTMGVMPSRGLDGAPLPRAAWGRAEVVSR
jgi:hypothetical protein